MNDNLNRLLMAANAMGHHKNVKCHVDVPAIQGEPTNFVMVGEDNNGRPFVAVFPMNIGCLHGIVSCIVDVKSRMEFGLIDAPVEVMGVIEHELGMRGYGKDTDRAPAKYQTH